MGQRSRHARITPLRKSVRAATVDDVASQGGQKSQHTDDVYTDARQRRLRRQSVRQVGLAGLECLGRVSCYRGIAGRVVGHGDHV